MKFKFKKILEFIGCVLVVVFSIIFASVMYKFNYILAGNFLSVLSGSYLLKMMLVYPEASMYCRLKKRLYKLAIIYEEALKDLLQYNDIVIIGVLAIFVVMISFSPLTIFAQWFSVVIFTILIFTFNEVLKIFK